MEFKKTLEDIENNDTRAARRYIRATTPPVEIEIVKYPGLSDTARSKLRRKIIKEFTVSAWRGMIPLTFMTKKEMVKFAGDRNIKARKSWKRDKILSAIQSSELKEIDEKMMKYMDNRIKDFLNLGNKKGVWNELPRELVNIVRTYYGNYRRLVNDPAYELKTNEISICKHEEKAKRHRMMYFKNVRFPTYDAKAKEQWNKSFQEVPKYSELMRNRTRHNGDVDIIFEERLQILQKLHIINGIEMLEKVKITLKNRDLYLIYRNINYESFSIKQAFESKKVKLYSSWYNVHRGRNYERYCIEFKSRKTYKCFYKYYED